ncbi:hypothetical protein ACVRXQ_06020 [Streptococcus panodentis]|uniref:Uncharacterized protein n=1 Tax=Streptococcus panodentis TaxID=1581472 RepID=A0ABS5AUU2_9STRE|nr:hypothetical protein [Streptococcus panodentis]MBP2620334.1 hypothetical protein [Streptococcus panodentis]
MIANIRVLEKDGNIHTLCQLDLMKFNIDQIQQRMEERGIKGENFKVCGFSDWETGPYISLEEAYLLKGKINNCYEGDDYLVRHMFQQRKTFNFVMAHSFKFVTKDEVELMKQLLKGADMDEVVEFFFKANNWVTAIQSYIRAGQVLSTPKGFYLDVGY